MGHKVMWRWLTLLTLLLPAAAAAQNFGNVKPGTILGNPDMTGSKPAVPTTSPVIAGSTTWPGLFKIDPNGNVAATGNALALMTPVLGDAHQDGHFVLCVPSRGCPGASTNVSNFFAPYNVTYGAKGDEVPAGKKGASYNYNCNIWTKQNIADTNGVDGFGCTGATVISLGTAPVFGHNVYLAAPNPGPARMLNFAYVSGATGSPTQVHLVDTASFVGDPANPEIATGLGGIGFGDLLRLAGGNTVNVIDTVSGTVSGDIIKSKRSRLAGDDPTFGGRMALGDAVFMRNGVGIGQHFLTDKNLNTFYNTATSNPRIQAENQALAPIALELSANPLILPDIVSGTPTGSLCLDAAKHVIVKTTTGPCI
jgi:hypothetical protein